MGPTVPFWSVALGDSAVTAVRVRKTPEAQLEVLGWWTAPVEFGEDPAAVALKVIRRRGLREHGLHIVLPGRGAVCRSGRISPEDADASPAELEREMYDFTPFEPEDAVVRVRRLGGAGVLDYRVVAEKRAALGRAEQLFDQAGCPFLGLSLAPAALLTAVEFLKFGTPHGYALEIHGEWSALTAVDGVLSVRYPIPFGLHDARRRLAVASPGTSLEQALDGPPAAAAFEPLGYDVRRLMDFHRAAIHGNGDETLLLAGSGADRKGLRAALAAQASTPLAPAPDVAGPGPLRAGPGVKPEALAAVLPALAVPLGAAASAAGLAPRDLDFRNLPDDLPAPKEGSLFPLAAGILAAAAAAGIWIVDDARAVLGRGRAAVEALPSPAPEGVLAPADASARAAELLRLVELARRRAALGRTLAAVTGAMPRAAGGNDIARGVERIQVLDEGGNVRARLQFRLEVPPGTTPSALMDRADPFLKEAQAAGWRLVDAKEGLLSLERLEMKSRGAQ